MLTKNAGTGTLVLSNNANTYTGLTFVNAGHLRSSVQGTATPWARDNRHDRGQRASVQVLAPGLTIAKPIVLNGTGVSPTNGGALENLIGGSNTWSGTITLQSPQQYRRRRQHDADASRRAPACIGGDGDLTKVGN